MKFFTENNKVNIVQSVASASTLISSLASEAREYVISKFPKNFFKSIYIETSETVVQQNLNNKYNKNLNKLPYPSCSIVPEISLDNPIEGMEKSINISSPNLFLRKNMNRTYKKLLLDPSEKMAMYYTSDYITANFNFKITMNSFIQNVDIAYFLRSSFQEGLFRYLNNKKIRTEIPKTFIKIIAKVKDYDLDKSEDMDALRLYLIGTSKQEEAILKKVNLSTGKTCFFMNEIGNCLTLFSNLDAPPSVIRENQVEGEYQINFTLQISAWLPNAFILSIDKSLFDIVEDIQVDGNEQDSGFYVHSMKLNTLTKHNTLEFLDNNGNEQIGQLIFSEIYTRELNDNVSEICFMDELPPELQKIHSFAVNNLGDIEIDLSQLIYVRFVDYDGDLDPSIYDFDYKTMTIKFKQQIDSDFAIGVYLNRVLYEVLLKAMNSGKFLVGSDFLTLLEVKTSDDSSQKIIVKSIDSNIENPSLKIMTPYGIGRVSLIDEIPDEDSIKISLGNGIKSLESLKTSKVRFIFNNGKDDLIRTAITGNPIGGLPKASKSDEKFIGWYTEDDQKITNSFVIDKDYQFLAKYSK